MTKSGKVGTYGGIQIPTVTIFMDGFLAGVNQYNKDSNKSVQVLGWDGKTGLFTGDFNDQDKGKSTTKSLVDEGADIIMPVAGPVGEGTVAYLKEVEQPRPVRHLGRRRRLQVTPRRLQVLPDQRREEDRQRGLRLDQVRGGR